MKGLIMKHSKSVAYLVICAITSGYGSVYLHHQSFVDLGAAERYHIEINELAQPFVSTISAAVTATDDASPSRTAGPSKR